MSREWGGLQPWLGLVMEREEELLIPLHKLVTALASVTRAHVSLSSLSCLRGKNLPEVLVLSRMSPFPRIPSVLAPAIHL